MRLGVTKESLLSALERVSRIVKSNPRSIEILQCVRLDTYGEDLFIIASSVASSARVQVKESKVVEGGSCVVNFDKLKDRTSKAGSIMVIDTDDHKNTMKIVSSEDQKLGLTLNDASEFPTISWDDPEESYGLDKAMFSKTLKMAANTCSRTSLTPALLQVCIQDQTIFSGSNSSYQSIPFPCNPTLRSTIPVSTTDMVISFVDESDSDTVWISQAGGEHVVITVGADQFQTTPLSVGFPDISKTLKNVRVATQYECKVRRSDLLAEISKARTSADSYGSVRIKLIGTVISSMEIEATNPEVGDWYESKVPCTWVGPEKDMTFLADDLSRFLRTFTSEELVLRLADDFRGNPTPLYCKEGEHEAILYQFQI